MSQRIDCGTPRVPMIDSNNLVAPKARFVLGSMYDIELTGYDAIIAVSEPFTYITRRTSRISTRCRFRGTHAQNSSQPA